MKNLIYAVALSASVLFAEGTNTGSMIDPSKVPLFNSCTDIAQIQKNKPILLNMYTNVLEETGMPAYSVKGPVDIDVKSGVIGYRVYGSVSNDLADTPTYANELCTKVDQTNLNQSVNSETQSIKAELEQMYNSVDVIYDQAQKESEQKSDGKTKSDVLGQALSGNVDSAKAAEGKVSNYSGHSAGMSAPHLGFMARVNSVNNELQRLIFLVSVLLSMVALGAGYLSKKLQKRADHEDYIARFGLGVILWFLLFAPANTYKYDSGEISQTRMQAIWGWVLDKGTGAANQLAGAAHREEMRYALKKSGASEVEKQIESSVRGISSIDNQLGAYESILHQCIQSYKINDLAMIIGEQKNAGKRYFPLQESMVKMGDEDVYSRYLHDNVDKNGIFMSLTTCGKAEEEYRQILSKKASLQEKINKAKELKFQESYTASARQIVKDSTSAGWISVAMLPVHHFLANGTGQHIEAKMKPAVKNGKENVRTDCEEVDGVWDTMVCHLENIERAVMPDSFMWLQDNAENISFDQIIETISQRMVMIMLPMVSSVYEPVKELFTWIPIIGAPLGHLVSFFITSDLGLIIINNLPFLLIVPAVTIVIGLYYAEVFFYSITIPYVAAYAFSRDQWGHLVKHAVRGIMIALKPAMIVISVYTAIYVSDIVVSINNDMIEQQTALLVSKYAPANDSKGSLSDVLMTSWDMLKNGDHTSSQSVFLGKFTMYIIQGILMVISAVVSVFIVIKIIISGPVMIMEMFGVRETDMASQMTEAITSRGQKYEGGI